MRVRFQVDADFDARIVRGLKRRRPEVDFQTAEDGGVIGLSDPDVLRIAAELERVLGSHDQRTMPAHFADFIADRTSSGLIIISQHMSLGAAIEELVLIWAATEPEEWINRLVWIPL